MNYMLKRLAPLQAGKMLAALYGLLSLVVVPFMFAFMTLGSLVARHQGGSPAPALPLLFGMGVGFMIFLPVLYALMGFVFGVIGAWVYNLLAGWLGGFEITLELKTPPAA